MSVANGEYPPVVCSAFCCEGCGQDFAADSQESKDGYHVRCVGHYNRRTGELEPEPELCGPVTRRPNIQLRVKTDSGAGNGEQEKGGCDS